MNKVECMKLTMRAQSKASWYYPLQKGFLLAAVSGMSVRQVLNSILQFDDAFIEDRVRTIFLNNSPVDNIDEAFLKDGDRMALGSAMPGLVGIVMGRDNPFKSFRSDISAQEGGQSGSRTPITISMKMFSTLAVESGTDILERGVLFDTNELADFLEEKVGDILDVGGKDGAAFLADLRTTPGTISVCVHFE